MAEAQPSQFSQPPEQSPRERIQRSKVLALRARHYWKGALALFLVGCGIAVAVAMQMKRTYLSECVVLVRQAMKTDEQENSAQDRAVRLAPRLKETLITRAVLEPIINEFSLYRETVESKGMIAAILAMKPMINVKGRDSETVVVSFIDEDPERARIITQRLADTIISEFKKANVSTKQQESEFLGAEFARAEKDVEEANRALASFLSLHPEFAAADALNSPFAGALGPRPQGLGPAGGPAPAPQVPSTSDPQLATLYRQKARLEGELKAAGQAAAPAPNETITSLTKTRDDAAKRAAQVQADLADKRTKLTDQHPDMVAAKGQAEQAATALRSAEAQLEAAKKTAAGAAPANPSADLTARLTELNGEIRARQNELARAAGGHAPAPAPPGSGKAADTTHPVVAMEIEWARLLRAVGDARAVHEDLRRRSDRARLKASATELSGKFQLEVIDPAYKPLQPQKGRRDRALIGLVLSLFVALAYASARTLLNDRVYDSGDIEALRLVPVLGVIPRLPPPPADPSGASTSTAMQAQSAQGVSRVG